MVSTALRRPNRARSGRTALTGHLSARLGHGQPVISWKTHREIAKRLGNRGKSRKIAENRGKSRKIAENRFLGKRWPAIILSSRLEGGCV